MVALPWLWSGVLKIGKMHFSKYAKARCWLPWSFSGLLTTGGSPNGFDEPPHAARVPSNVIESIFLRSTVMRASTACRYPVGNGVVVGAADREHRGGLRVGQRRRMRDRRRLAEQVVRRRVARVRD